MAAKIKQEYDENGRWVQERNRIKGAMRQSFRLAPQMKEVLQAARVELPPKLKKDGTPGKKNQVRYRCAGCSELFPQTFNKSRAIQVDHIDPVVPLWKREEDMSYDELARGIYCPVSNLQVMCSIPISKNDGKRSCHQMKTDEENWIRKQLRAFLEGEGLMDRKDVDFSRFVESHKQLYKEYLIEKEEKANEKRKKRKK